MHTYWDVLVVVSLTLVGGGRSRPWALLTDGKPPGLERGGTHARNIAAGLQAIEAEGGAGRSIGNAHTALTDGSRFANRAHQKITEAIHEQSPPQYRATPGAAAIS